MVGSRRSGLRRGRGRVLSHFEDHVVPGDSGSDGVVDGGILLANHVDPDAWL